MQSKYIFSSWESVAIQYCSPDFCHQPKEFCHLDWQEMKLNSKQLWEIDTRSEYLQGRKRRRIIIITFVIRGRETRIDQNLLLLRNETMVQSNEHTATPLLNIQFTYIHSNDIFILLLLYDFYYCHLYMQHPLNIEHRRSKHICSFRHSVIFGSRTIFFVRSFPFLFVAHFHSYIEMDTVNNIFFLGSFCLLMHIEKYVLCSGVFQCVPVWAYS